MKKHKQKELDFIVDKLTNSIENIQTGEVFDTIITRLTSVDNNLVKKRDWRFDWLNEVKDKTKETYKLTTVNNPKIIQGLESVEDNKTIFLCIC